MEKRKCRSDSNNQLNEITKCQCISLNFRPVTKIKEEGRYKNCIGVIIVFCLSEF